MTIADTPAFAKTQRAFAALTTGAVPLTGSNSYLTDTPDFTVQLADGGTLGTIVTGLSAMPRATVGAANLTIWRSTSAGTVKSVLTSITHPGATVSATAATPAVAFCVPGTTTPISEANPYRLAAGDKLFAGSTVALAGGWQFSGSGTDISDATV